MEIQYRRISQPWHYWVSDRGILCCVATLCICRVFSIIPGLYPPPPVGMPGPPLLPVPPFPALSPAVVTTKNISRRCQKSPAGQKSLFLRTLDAREFKFLAIWLVGYQGGAGALVSLRKWVVVRLLVVLKGELNSGPWNASQIPLDLPSRSHLRNLHAIY